jgi:hypothetical protein
MDAAPVPTVHQDVKARRNTRQRTRAATSLTFPIAARKLVLHAIDVLSARLDRVHGWIYGMKTNITLKLDADILREARIFAAEEGRSISALLTERLESMVRERKSFDKARRRALARLRDGLDLQWTPPKSRDELHER